MLADYVVGLLQELKITQYTIYMQDFGAPVGFRVMMREQGTVKGLIVQNANAYMEGLTQMRRDFFRNAYEDRTTEGINKLYEFISKDSIINKQYLRDVKGKEETMSPDSWGSDLTFLQTDKDRKIMMQLFQDYYTNLMAYPSWQNFLRSKHPPTLIVWGKRDPAFISAGAQAYLNDLPDAELHLIDAGHFAVEEKPVEIAKYIIEFMDRISK
jgi:pimeloyl-ACP methyl ester carboxylesterase